MASQKASMALTQATRATICQIAISVGALHKKLGAPIRCGFAAKRCMVFRH